MIKSFPDWNELYLSEKAENLPWFCPSLDSDLDKTLNHLGIRGGKFLDLGTGPGTQAIALAKKGFQVTATDISEAAVLKAAERAKTQGVRIRFETDDVLKSGLHDLFTYAFDRGVFHVFKPEQRPVYVEALRKRLWTGGYLFLKCFSAREPWNQGPYRFTPDQIRDCFEKRFKILSIRETSFKGTLKFEPKALFCVLRCRK